MRILLLGEYSNVHATLARGLRALGHEVCVASDGDVWKNYPRDVDLKRTHAPRTLKKDDGFARYIYNKVYNVFWSAVYFCKLAWAFRLFRGYDVVQLINPLFLELRAERIAPWYKYLRHHNRHIVLGAYGMDYYYIKACFTPGVFRYSDFFIGTQQRHYAHGEQSIAEWYEGAKAPLCQSITNDADAVVAGLWEYYRAMQVAQIKPLYYVPFPIIPPSECAPALTDSSERLKVFIGIQRARNEYKGTDLMLRAAQRVAAEMPERVELRCVENVPFEEYVRLMRTSDVLLDQIYSYTPGMNALEAMAQGLIVVSGGEEEHYALLQESELRPIINVEPTEESVYQVLVRLAQMQHEEIARLKAESKEYIRRHHDYIQVAKQYEAIFLALQKL